MNTEFELTTEDLPEKPSIGFLALATEVAMEADRSVDRHGLAVLLQGAMSKCEQTAAKRMLILAAENLHGPAAKLARNRIYKILPPQWQTERIANTIIKLGSYAAQVPELWELIVNVRIAQQDCGEAQRRLSEVRQRDEAAGDDHAPLSER
jgi:hypothetical protein